MARILSIDYGKKRTGIAVTDPLQIIANGLATVATSELMPFLKKYVSQEAVERVVIGEPRQPNGQPSENLQRVRQFVALWKKQMPQIPIDLFDERYTSVLAHQAMLDGGLRKKARQNKELVDEISATIILQDYMAAKRR
ncbi:MAG: Holliday junction resolvase RuvX [Prevotella sp.]|nr:Holliday junction resolvase RuvX [Prevotella sp.]MDD7045879.1 Holliday junction resolvase RuvX [Prevotella sp.]MDY5546636.1 Holliday junction resolvase RuvX [Prevotella sp.]